MSVPARAPARIMIVEDHPIVRLGIHQMITADPTLRVCCETQSAEEALRCVPTAMADLAVVDLSLPGDSGLTLIRALREAAPALPVLVLSMHDEVLFAERTIGAGARGYIMKQEAIDSLVHAIHEVLAGRIYVSDRMAQRLLERVGQDTSSPAAILESLSNRELEVFELIGRGLSTAAIATRLGVSVKTVETYRSNIKTKLNLKSAAELIRFAASWSERL